MDKKLVLAVAGSGKTTEIINKVNYDDKTIIITYTENNYNNIRNKIIKKFNEIPPNMRIYTYFSFLYKFCFLPLKKNLNVKGIDYNTIKNK
jgi:DNA helicase-2/ATP-dependent DNA helicase PcrA